MCVTLLRKSRSVENVCNNKKFWKLVKQLLSKKIIPSEKIILAEGTKSLKNEKETAKVLNNFFSTMLLELCLSKEEMILLIHSLKH